MNKQFLVLVLVIAVIGVGVVLFTQQKKSNELNPSPPALTKVSLVLDWFPYSAHSGLFVSQERGYFRAEGLAVEIRVPSDPATVSQTVATGRDDFGINYQPDLLLGRAEGVPVVSIAALVQHPLNSILTLQSSGLSRPRDLAGKKVGHAGIPFIELVLDTMLKSDGVAGGLNEVEFVNVGFDLVPALISKRVDAIVGAFWTTESISAQNQGFPTNIMRIERYGVPDYYELILVTNEEKIAKQSDLVQRFVRAVTRGYQDAMADPQGAVQLMKQVKPEVDLAIDSPGVKLLAPLWKPENGVFGWQEENRWVDLAKWMKDNSLLQKDVDAKKAFNNTFVENTNKK